MQNHSGEAVSVDDQFVRVGGKSYAVGKITSVEVRGDPAPKDSSLGLYLGAILLGIIGLSLPVLLIGSIVLGVLGYQAQQKAKVRTHRLILTLASTEAAAMVSDDHAAICSLREEIEQAMTLNSRATVLTPRALR